MNLDHGFIQSILISYLHFVWLPFLNFPLGTKIQVVIHVQTMQPALKTLHVDLFLTKKILDSGAPVEVVSMANDVKILNQSVCHTVRPMHSVNRKVVENSRTQTILYVSVLYIVLGHVVICVTKNVIRDLVSTMEHADSEMIQAVSDHSSAFVQKIITEIIVRRISLPFTLILI